MPRAQEKRGERGFALLLIFLMAAAVALMLYAQMPRVAFESQRDKEQVLIDHGNQYKRAIQLYVTALKKYPSRIEDLENTNDKRYLRKRYIDPMTGKDEWRLIHVNAGGVLTDSLVEKPPTPDGKPATQNATGTGSAPAGTGASAAGTNAAGTADPNAPPEVNAAVRQRPSDLVGQAYSQPATVDPNDPSTWAPITLTPTTPGQPNGQPPTGAVGFNGGIPGRGGQPIVQQFPGAGQQGATGQPGMPAGVAGSVPGGLPGLPGQPGFNPTQNQFRIDQNGQLVPITPTQPGQTGSQTATGQQSVFPGQPGQGQTGQLQQQTGQAGAPTAAPGVSAPTNVIGQINQMLMNPSQMGTGLTPSNMSSSMVTGGIAGVASNYKGPSIKIVNDRQKYQEWEFVYKLNNGQTGAPGQPVQNQNGQNPQGAPPNGANPMSGSGTGAPSTGNP